MTLSPDLAERLYAWIKESPNEGHAYQCRAMSKLKEHYGPCNCGRDDLLASLAECLKAPAVVMNGTHP